MTKIVIIDVDNSTIKKVRHLVSSISINYDIDIIIEGYNKYDVELQKEIGNQEYKKIYILEIDLLGELSGIEIAEKIREEDWLSEIIFLTNHQKMFETVYRSVPRVFDFIEKFHNVDNRLSKDIEKIFKQKFDKQMIIYKSGKTNLKLYYKSVIYIYRDTISRKINIVTKNNTYELNCSLKEMHELLDNRFKIVHRACIVNMDFVSSLDWKNNSFVLENGDTINLLSKKYKDDLEEIFN